MEGLNKKYNFVNKRELHIEDNLKRFKKFKQIIDSQNLGLRVNQYKDIKNVPKLVKKEEELKVNNSGINLIEGEYSK